MNKYREALNRLRENDYFDEDGNCDCDLVEMDLELLQELVDKATPKKIVYINNKITNLPVSKCPNCGIIEVFLENFNYCHNCGQMLDRSDKND